MRRLFFAIHVPASYQTREVLSNFQQALTDARINWVDPEHLHLTLKFFADTPNHMIRDIISAARYAASESEPFQLYLEGCGTFGTPKDPRVLWIGTQSSDALNGLYNQLHKRLKTLGFKPDKQTFGPHITIGRIKQLTDQEMLKQMLMAYKSGSFGNHHVHSFNLYESILHPDGPEYKVVEKFELS